MSKARYQALGPLLAGEGSRAFLGLEIPELGSARPVVLVWVPDAVAKDEDALQKLKRETALAIRLDHPNIIRVHGLASLDEGMARVVEFADGESVHNLLEAAKRIPPPLAALIVADAALGVHFAHLAGRDDGTPLIHGDLRPETLLITFSGLCKVTGYGAVTLAPREIGGQRIPGRRFHAAPEQVVGGREAVDRQTDIYLLGLLLYECITGSVPFADHDEFDRAILLRPLPAPPPEEMPPDLYQVVRQATAKKAEDRYPSALALREAVEKALGTLPSRDQLAEFLRAYFPHDHPARLARHQEIEAGIAEAARASGTKLPMPEKPTVPVAPTPLSTPRQRAPLPVARPSPPQARPSLSYQPEEEFFDVPERPKSAAPMVVVGLLAMIVGVVGYRVATRPYSSPRLAPPLPRVTQVSPPAPAEDAGSPKVIAEANSKERADPLSRPIAPSPTPPVAAPSPSSSLEVSAEPPLEVTIDGSAFGRSPVVAPVPPGKHEVTLSDTEKGIHVTRTVRVGQSGKTPFHLTLRKGFVEVVAPRGATVLVDGKRVGEAPLKEFELFEGRHQIDVKYRKADWRQNFTVHPNEHLTFNVETTSQ